MLERGLVLPHRIAALAAEDPRRPLLIRADTNERTSYGEFHAMTMKWAGSLQRLGVQPGDRVATLLTPSATAYATWLAVAWLQAIEVPVNTMLTGQLLTHVLADSGARLVIVAPDLLLTVLAVAATLPELEAIVVAGRALPEGAVSGPAVLSSDELLTGPPAQGLVGPEPYDICCLCYTSGTTGAAKGVLVPWAEMWEFVVALGDRLEPDMVYYSCYPMFHVSGKQALYGAATVANCLVFRPQFSVREFWPDVRRHGGTAIGLVGPMARMLLIQPPGVDDADNAVQWAAIGPLFPEVNDFARRFGVTIWTGYGMTEIGAPLAHVGEITDWQSCGRQRSGYELRIVDEHDLEVPHGQVGELLVRSDEPWKLNAGYFGLADLTARVWRNGWFHTGDAFRRNEGGDFYFVDRLTDSIRRRGENISSFEIEVSANAVDGVAESAAFGVPSELGEDDVKLVVVLKPDTALDPAALLAELEAAMPHYMVPRYVEIAGELPKTPTSRTRKVELRAAAFNPRTWDTVLGTYLSAGADGVHPR